MTVTRPEITQAVAGTKNTAKAYNDNFDEMIRFIDDSVDAMHDYCEGYLPSLTSQAGKLLTNNGTTTSWMSDEKYKPIGQPIPRLDDTLFDNEIRLEGAAVSRTDYAALFAIYGTTYGEGNGSTTFNLPDLRDRTLWGSSTAGGYIDGELPNITGVTVVSEWSRVGGYVSGAFYDNGYINKKGEEGEDWGNNHQVGFNASLMRYGENSDIQIYKDNTYLVRPTAVKVRWVTRFE